MVDGESSFEHFNEVTDDGGEIEVLFIERMKQLIKPGGYAGIILPQSLLSNTKKYSSSRELIFRHFVLKAIVLLGNCAFMKTGTNTAVLFMKKRDKVLDHLRTPDDYIQMAADQTLLLIDSGSEVGEQRKFLGYSFSDRKGKEGIEIYSENKLVNENRMDDPTKVSCYIHRALLNEPIGKIDKNLEKNAIAIPLAQCFSPESQKFCNTINLAQKVEIDSSDVLALISAYPDKNRCPLVSLRDLRREAIIVEKKGTSITKRLAVPGDFPVVASGLTDSYTHNKSNCDGDVVTISASGSAGIIRYHSSRIWASDCTVVYSINPSVLLTKFLYYALYIQSKHIKKIAHGSVQKHLYFHDIENIKVPLPSLKWQNKIVKERTDHEAQIAKKQREISDLRAQISGDS